MEKQPAGTFALKGIVAHTPTFDEVEFHDNSYVVCRDGKCVGIFDRLPEEFRDVHVYDYTDRFILPGMCDMHLHAPQYAFRGMSRLIDCNSQWGTWFERYAFPEETLYKDLDYADKAYGRLVDDLLTKTTTTRAAVFATIHRPATELLMRKMADAGFIAYVGKVNMDRNSKFGLIETTEESLRETRQWLEDVKNGDYGGIKPILTPRYTPSCTDECMEGLAEIAREYNVPVQSHLSEGLDEFEWVKSLKPEVECYADAYDMYGLLGSTVPAIMAHCIHPTEKEFRLLRERNVLVVHCPQSNLNGCCGVAPVLDYVRAGVKVALGSDMAGGTVLNLLRAVTDAVQASKARWMFVERKGDPRAKKDFLMFANAMYLATKGGGQFFGRVGSFEPGYEFDAVVLDDGDLKDFIDRGLRDRLERICWLFNDRTLEAKFIGGRSVYQRG